MVWGAIIGAGIAAYSAWQASEDQKKAQKESNAANFAQTAEGQSILQGGKSAALSAQQKGIKFADESFAKALGSVGTIGEATRGRVLRRGEQFSATADARAADRGLYDSTKALNDQRGVFESTNQTLAGIDEAVAGLMAQIHQNRGTTALQGYQGMANIHQNFAFQSAGLATQNQHQAANVGAGYAAAAGGLAKLLMMYSSSGGGGSGGGDPMAGADAYANDQYNQYPEVY